jgi:parallel beta-helix repeat protein
VGGGKMNIKKQLVLSILPIHLTLVLASYALATNYYVNGSSGNDTYNGLYATYQGGSNGPWKSLGKASATVPNGTHTINVATGTYSESRVTDSRSGAGVGTERYWKANGEVIISNGFTMSGNHIKFEGFTLSAQGSFVFSSGANIRSTGNYNMILSNHIHNSEQEGIYVTGSNNTVQNNVIHDCHMMGMSVSGTNHSIVNNDISHIHKPAGQTWYDADGIRFFGSGHTFRGNYIHDLLWSDQVDVADYPHMDAFQTFGDNAHNVIFEKNHIFMGNTTTGTLEDCILQGGDYNSSCGWMLENCYNITIRNNVVEAWTGIKSQVGSNSNFKIYNNTFRGDQANHHYSPTGVAISGLTTLEIYNNITVDFYVHYQISGTGFSYDYNLMWDSDGGTPNLTGYTPQAHDKRGVNPMFLTFPPSTPIVWSPSGYKLQSDSIARDAGITISSVTDDYNGISRPQGSYYDIGAYEYTTSTSSPMPPTGLKVLL